MDDADKVKYFERKLRNSKKGSRTYMEALIELRNIPGSGYSVPSGTEDQPMDSDPSEVKPEKSSKLKDGGMARGKGGKMYQHNYAAGGQVVDNLSKPTGHPTNQAGGKQMERRMPMSVQAATALPGETPAQRSKRLRSGG